MANIFWRTFHEFFNYLTGVFLESSLDWHSLFAYSQMVAMVVGLTRLEAIADRRSVPGVMLFAGTGDVLFMNAEAEVLTRQIMAARAEAGAQEVLPVEIRDLCVSLRNALEHLMIKRILKGSMSCGGSQVICRLPCCFVGFRWRSHSINDDACMLVLMEKIGRERRIVS